MREITATVGSDINLGRRGEHQATCVNFDFSGWMATHGEGSIQLIHQRNGDREPYPVALDVSGGVATWVVTNSDVAVAGRGWAELRYFVGDVRVKSQLYATVTERALGARENAPAAYQNWVDQVMEAAVETEENASQAASYAMSASGYAQDSMSAKSGAESAKEAAEAAQSAAETDKAGAETAKSGAETARAGAETAASAASGAAKLAESWAEGGTGTRQGEDTNNSKYWSEQAKISATGTRTFNGRFGDVLPQSGDYTAEMVGAADRTLSNLSDKQKALYNIGGRPRKNLLDNPKFEVNQRNQAIYAPTQSSDAICIDRWWKTSDCTVEVLDNGIRITNRPNDFAQIYQFLPIHKAQSLVGENLTISALFNDGTLITGSGLVQQLSYDFVSVVDIGGLGIYTYMNTIRISYNLAYKPQEEVRAIKLEVGEGQTLAHQDSNGVWQLFDDYNYTADLLACQRRYFRVEANQTYTYFGSGMTASGNAAIIELHTPVEMADDTTLTVSADNLRLICGDSGAEKSLDISTLNLWRRAANSVTIRVVANGTISESGGFARFYAAGAGSYLALSAEL